jgi:ferric-dicitrate binding protein FerR (iron transport regulator)
MMQHDVPAPQGNKAMLTLSDGSMVPLDSVRQGTLATQGNARIIKRADGQIAYNTAINSLHAIATYNTLTVPRGSQPVQLVLADGSHVWLNVASSITYPTSFTGAARNVQLKGEGYFEIAHDAAHPFTVETAGMKVQVLGTQFNIMAYDDEAGVQTTLAQGSVKVSRGNSSAVIKPGEQAVPNGSHEGFTVRNANLEEVLAWKNGYFFFQDADLPVLLRQFARWYNIDINYQGQPRAYQFVGKLPRTAKLSSALKLLEVNDIPFRFENNHLTIQR